VDGGVVSRQSIPASDRPRWKVLRLRRAIPHMARRRMPRLRESAVSFLRLLPGRRGIRSEGKT